MKKLKCESCGGTVEVEENNEFATCPFCKARYKLNETKNIYIKLDDNTKELLQTHMTQTTKISKIIFIPFIIVFITIFVMIFISILGIPRNFNKGSNSNTKNNYIEKNNETEEAIKNIRDTISKNSFNWSFEAYSGSKYKSSVEIVLDNVVTNNKTNKELLVTVAYKDNETTDPDTIIEIKHSLIDRRKYEVKIDYDEYGYVNKITIEDL